MCMCEAQCTPATPFKLTNTVWKSSESQLNSLTFRLFFFWLRKTRGQQFFWSKRFFSLSLPVYIIIYSALFFLVETSTHLHMAVVSSRPSIETGFMIFSFGLKSLCLINFHFFDTLKLLSRFSRTFFLQ